jgi:flagellin-specific chaperone FliS
MKKKQLNRLLNTACEIITELEHNADADQQKKIDTLFNEIKYSDELDEEMQKNQVDEIRRLNQADWEAQDTWKQIKDR